MTARPADDIARIRAVYSDADKARCSERFRRHVWSPRRWRGRIHRLYRCCYCETECQTEAHHVDYSKPFLVSWLCTSCHRSVEQDGIVLKAKHLFDYSSLILTRPNRWRTGTRGVQYGGVKKGKKYEEAPF